MEEATLRFDLLFQLTGRAQLARGDVARADDLDRLGEAVLQMRDVLEEDGFMV